MRKLKHIIAIIIVLFVVVGTCVFILPRISSTDSSSSESSSAEIAAQDTTVVEDTLSFADKFKQELQVIQESYSKRTKAYTWTLGRGQTIIVYLLQAKRFVEKMGGQILLMEEVHNDQTAFQTANFHTIQPDGDTLKLVLKVSDNVFRNNASEMVVAFQVTNLTPELIVGLNQLDYPYDLLIPPFGMSEGFYPDLDHVKNKELVLWITMESTKLNKVHNKLRPLRIHHTAEQIETVINDAKKLVPNAVGVATRYGEQAVEHKQLLQAILAPTQKNNLWFMDISTNKLSKVAETCKDFKILCKTANPYNPDNSALDDYIKQKTREASKSGLSVMILPLNETTLNKVSDLSKKMQSKGTTLVNLSTFMKY